MAGNNKAGVLIDQATKNSLAHYMEALKLYRSQSWDLAEAEFIQLQKLMCTYILTL